jgi:hypothetical protein
MTFMGPIGVLAILCESVDEIAIKFSNFAQ